MTAKRISKKILRYIEIIEKSHQQISNSNSIVQNFQNDLNNGFSRQNDEKLSAVASPSESRGSIGGIGESSDVKLSKTNNPNNPNTSGMPSYMRSKENSNPDNPNNPSNPSNPSSRDSLLRTPQQKGGLSKGLSNPSNPSNPDSIVNHEKEFALIMTGDNPNSPK